MSIKKVFVKKDVQQIVDGSHYKGCLHIGGIKFEYEMIFSVPISKLDDSTPVENLQQIRKIFQINVKKDNIPLELTDIEYQFFFNILTEFIIIFYNQPQTRQSNEGRLGPELQGVGKLALYGATYAIGMESSATYDLPLQICEVLATSKFGCVL